VPQEETKKQEEPTDINMEGPAVADAPVAIAPVNDNMSIQDK